MREISAFGRGPARTAEMVDNSWRFAHFQLRFLKERAFQIGFIEAMTALGGLAVLTVGVWLMTQGSISRPELILAVILSVAAFAPISDIARTMKQLMETLAASRRLFVVHDEPVPVTDGPGVHSHHAESGANPGWNPGPAAAMPGAPLPLLSKMWNSPMGRASRRHWATSASPSNRGIPSPWSGVRARARPPAPT